MRTHPELPDLCSTLVADDMFCAEPGTELVSKRGSGVVLSVCEKHLLATMNRYGNLYDYFAPPVSL